ncbi:MAG: methionine biosynthesis protein MetW [Desulfobacteraceae bacterium]|nr:methionine biosynthesis protein MetW [Desulfobacteraceae bacterium]
MPAYEERLDHSVIASLIEPGSSVLDLGCGTGELLYLLISDRGVHGQGLEIDEHAIYTCVARGLNVYHGDIDSGLSEYPDGSFDYVILNQSLQQLIHVESVMADALRVGKRVIVGFPNFAHYRTRIQLFFHGRAPVTASLPYPWYETPNLHFLSISDFFDFCRHKNIRIERAEYLGDGGRVHKFPNLLAEIGIFVIGGRIETSPGTEEADK